jgi:hypothetical protein
MTTRTQLTRVHKLGCLDLSRTLLGMAVILEMEENHLCKNSQLVPKGADTLAKTDKSLYLHVSKHPIKDQVIDPSSACSLLLLL